MSRDSIRTLTPVAVIHLVAERLADPEVVQHTSRHFAPMPSPRAWEPMHYGFGDIGLALFYDQMQRCFPEEGYDQVARRYLARVLQPHLQTKSLSLFQGLAGCGVAVLLLSHQDSRVQRHAQTLITALAHHCLERYCAALAVRKQEISIHDYDLVSGATGMGVCLLLGKDLPGAREGLEAVVSYLIHLSRTDEHTPGYALAPAQVQARHRAHYPGGYTICGMAHGVAGPLALLSLARLHGIKFLGMLEAIERLANWLLAHSIRDDWGIIWPTLVGNDGDEVSRSLPSRASWCYGSPGIAWALWLAGSALAQPEVQAMAVRAIEAVCLRPPGARGLVTPGLCHGLAGLLHLLHRFQQVLPTHALLQRTITEVQEALLACCDPALPFGFADRSGSRLWFGNPGLVSGAAGIALALLSLVSPQEPLWDCLFLLSGGAPG